MINPHNLLKAEMRELLTKRCKHHHLYIEHPKCWEKERNRPPKVGYFDIETGGLKANTDLMLCYSIKTQDKDEILHGSIKKEDIHNEIFDRNLIKQLIKDLLKYDVIMTYYGTGFDLPFTRTRALSWGLSFIPFGMVKHKDVYYMAKAKLCLTSKSLDTVCELLKIKGKNHIKWRVWIQAKHGNEQALAYVQDHCDKDVAILEKAHRKLEIFVKPTVKSI